MLNKKVRIVLIVIIAILVIAINIKPDMIKMQEQANYFDRDATGKDQEYAQDVENTIKLFFEKLEKGKYLDAYEMIDSAYKKDKFDTAENFEKYAKQYLIDQDKYGKVVEYGYLLKRLEDEQMIYTYEINLYSKDFSKEPVNPYLAATESVKIDYYTGREFTMDVVEHDLYDFKIGLSCQIIE